MISALHRGEKRLVFCDSRAGVEALSAELRRCGAETFVSHSSLALDERRRAEEAFSQSRDCVFPATADGPDSLKFFSCLPEELALRTVRRRGSDTRGVRACLSEPIRHLVAA